MADCTQGVESGGHALLTSMQAGAQVGGVLLLLLQVTFGVVSHSRNTVIKLGYPKYHSFGAEEDLS